MNSRVRTNKRPREVLARFFITCGLLYAGAVQAQDVAPLASNASPTETRSINDVLTRLQRAAEARDVNALQFYGASVPADDSPVKVSARTTQIATASGGALVRQSYVVQIMRRPAVTLASGTQELWLARLPDGTFTLTPRRFAGPVDAVDSLSDWATTESQTPDSDPAMLDLIASRVGGRWIPLRYQRWEGSLYTRLPVSTPDASVSDYVNRGMNTVPKGRAVTVHFLFQKSGDNWTGIGSATSISRRISPAADYAAAQWRDRMAGSDYTLAASHRDFGLALTQVGLLIEAADELQKAELLQPGLVGADKLKEAEAARGRDPQAVIQQQMQQEANVGVGKEHPNYLINALKREQRNQPTVLGALRLALEYSRLADEDRALAWKNEAEDLMNRGGGPLRPQDRDWISLLYDHLNERRRLAASKPPVIVRSPLFTVRMYPNDAGSIATLASLEEAQHTVYADFGIPMGNTEVLLWRNQGEFARYTTQFSAQGGSEFVAALTLTKLVSTKEGPLVLGEEVNTFADLRDPNALFSTLAHEYGHVAVRNLSRGRMVPVWFNEGIATSVEGGYEGYINRVRRGASAGALLSMREMLAWNVDGERAFLAYSQANSIVDYIVSKWGKGAVLEILRQIGQDIPPETAFKSVIGIGQQDLWNRWVQEGIK